MSVYEVVFLDGVEKKTAYIAADTENFAGKQFSQHYPTILPENIMSVSLFCLKDRNKVSISDIDIPFMTMVMFMVKFVIAAIPATILLSIIWGAISGVILAILR